MKRKAGYSYIGNVEAKRFRMKDYGCTLGSTNKEVLQSTQTKTEARCLRMKDHG